MNSSDSSKKTAFAALVSVIFGPYLRKAAHRMGEALDAHIPADSFLRSGLFERAILAGLSIADIRLTNPVLKTVLPTTGEMLAVAFLDGDDGVGRQLQRYERQAREAANASSNPGEEVALFKERLEAMKAIAEIGKGFREGFDLLTAGSPQPVKGAMTDGLRRLLRREGDPEEAGAAELFAKRLREAGNRVGTGVSTALRETGSRIGTGVSTAHDEFIQYLANLTHVDLEGEAALTTLERERKMERERRWYDKQVAKEERRLQRQRAKRQRAAERHTRRLKKYED